MTAVSQRRPFTGAAFLSIAMGALLLFSCRLLQPEVVVVNRIAPEVMVKNPSFNGVVWEMVLAYGQATSPRCCLTGEGRVHFQQIDAHYYCRRQAEYSLIDSLCLCDSSWMASDTDVISKKPLWFNFRTISTVDPPAGGFVIVELTSDNLEQDFSVPGPYGH